MGTSTLASNTRCTAACDAYVSLRRAEGLGLHMAEAMALGKPVVATGYSGNLEFMDETNSWLVPYDLVAVPDGCDPYPTNAVWAEPDIDVAAHIMREIVADTHAAQLRGERAAADIATLHSPHARANFLLSRLEAIATHPGAAANKEAEEARAPWSAVELRSTTSRRGPTSDRRRVTDR